MEELSKALTEEMERRGHSNRQAAELIGVAPGTIGNWAKGWIVGTPQREHLDGLAEYLGLPRFVILGWLDYLNNEQVELLRTIPGSLDYHERLALSMAQQHLFTWPELGYLNPPATKLLAS